MRTNVENFLSTVGLHAVSETGEEIIMYCPFHNNMDTPSFSVNKRTGLWQCFNPQCGKSGRFATLAKLLKGEEYQVDTRDDSSWSDVISAWNTVKREGMTIDGIAIDYRNDDDVAKLEYIIQRGFTIETLEYFEVGFSSKYNRIAIPIRDLSYKVVGIIGRAVSKKQVPKYYYSRGFPRKYHLFNLHNAKDYETVIITEGSLDAIKVHQAGYPNVVASLGSKLSNEQATLINKYFDDIIIFSDNDDAGAGLRSAIMDMCPRKGIKVVEYPEGKKDPGEMTENQIIQCVDNAIDEIDYIFQ